jgi:hypothetical protein
MKFHFVISIMLLTISSCVKSYQQLPDVTTGLVVNIPLDGNALETISYQLGITNNVTPTANRHQELGKAMMFQVVDSSWINFGDLPSASFTGNQFTISCWVRVMDTSQTIAVLSKRGPFGPFEYSLDTYFGREYLTLDNWEHQGGSTVYGVDPLDAGAPIRLNTWQHIAFVADGVVLRVYSDGVLQSGVDLRQGNHKFIDTDANFIIGNGGAWAKSHYFKGAIDDIKMYNRALTADAINYLAKL